MLAKLIIDTLTAVKNPIVEEDLVFGLVKINPAWDVRPELDRLEQEGKIVRNCLVWNRTVSLPGPHKLKHCEPRVGAVDAIMVSDETLRDGIDHPGLTRKLSCFILPGGTYAYKGDWIVLRNGVLTVFTNSAFYELWKQP